MKDRKTHADKKTAETPNKKELKKLNKELQKTLSGFSIVKDNDSGGFVQ